MKQIIKDTIENYFIDENTFQVYRKSNRTNKMLKVNWKADKEGMSVTLALFLDKEKGRTRKRQITFENIIGNFILNLKEKYIFEYNDNNSFNINKENIRIKYINDICNNWKQIENSDKFFVSKNGDVYDNEKHRLIRPTKDMTGYYHYSINGVHIKRSHLVWKYFAENNTIPKGYVIDHINNIAYDDRIENLQCITTRENIVKEHKRDLPTGVIKDGNRYKSYISYTLKSVKYESCYLGSFTNAGDAGECYQKALALINQGINPIKTGENKNIKYKFANNTWYFTTERTGKPSKKHSGFKTYEEALSAYNKFIELDTSNESDEDKILRRGYFSLHILDKTYDVRRYKYSTDEFLSAYRFYKQCRQENRINDFIDALPSIREKIKNESDTIKTELKHKEKEKKEAYKKYVNNILKKDRMEKKQAKEEAKLNFVANPNYKKNTYNDCYTISVPHIDGKWYYLCSFKDFELVKEIDTIMEEHKYLEDFPEFFKSFKESELPKYTERDMAYRAERRNENENRKGYGWFKPRNCWRVIKDVSNKQYCLGYFRDERCCKMILDEAANAVKAGVFDNWYENIENHKYRIKRLFNDESLPENKTFERQSAIFQTGRKIYQYKNNILVNTYPTLVEASKQFATSNAYKSIGECCRGNKKSYMGYEWKYINE